MLQLNSSIFSNMINLIVLYLFLKHFLFQPIQNVIKQREELIQSRIADANEMKQQASECKKKYEDALMAAHDESANIITKAKQVAREEADAMIAEANQEAIRIRKDAESVIEQERKREMKKMQDQVAGLALSAVQKILSQQPNEQENNNLYNRFLQEAGEQNDANRA